jgi:hypothetical protein
VAAFVWGALFALIYSSHSTKSREKSHLNSCYLKTAESHVIVDIFGSEKMATIGNILPKTFQ